MILNNHQVTSAQGQWVCEDGRCQADISEIQLRSLNARLNVTSHVFGNASLTLSGEDARWTYVDQGFQFTGHMLQFSLWDSSNQLSSQRYDPLPHSLIQRMNLTWTSSQPGHSFLNLWFPAYRRRSHTLCYRNQKTISISYDLGATKWRSINSVFSADGSSETDSPARDPLIPIYGCE